MTKILTISAAILLLFGAFAFAADSKKPAPTAQLGLSGTSDAIEVDLAKTPDFSAADAKTYREPPEPRNPYFSEEQLMAIKKNAITAPPISRPGDAARNTPQPRNSGAGGETPGDFINFAGANEGETCSGLTPSDMGLAVSSKFVVQVTNACVQISNKIGGTVTTKTLDTIFGWPAGTFTFDPRATYDWVKGRFIIIASTRDASGVAWIDVAASATNNPTGTWHSYHLSTPSGTTTADYPTLGQSWANDKFNAAIFVCYNQFTSGGFTSDYCYYLPKKQIYAGLGFSYYFNFNFNANGVLLDTIQPVNVAQADEEPRTEYAVDTFNINGANGLVLWSFANVLVQSGTPGPSITGVVVGTPSSYSYPANADNAGFCSNCIETLDNRITSMVQYSAGRLFPTIDTANGGTSAVLGWVVRPYLNDNGSGTCTGTFANACPAITGATIETEFCDYCGAGSFAAFFGDIAPTEENNWTMFATFSSTSTSPGMFYDSNRVSWQTPFHDSGVFACQNNASYTQGRWGDYSAAAPDFAEHTNETATWGSGMYILSNGTWGTCIAANRYGSVEDI
jgi:hypothetical protein